MMEWVFKHSLLDTVSYLQQYRTISLLSNFCTQKPSRVIIQVWNGCLLQCSKASFYSIYITKHLLHTKQLLLAVWPM